MTGSHKAVAPMPEAFRWHTQVAECIVQPSMPRGSICFFMGYAGNHGTFAWHGAEQRRTVLFNYLSKHVEYVKGLRNERLARDASKL